MNVEDLIEDFRADADDPVLDGDTDQEDVFWTDDDLIRYIDEAQRWIARKAFALRSILNLTITANVATITPPREFLEVRDDIAYLQSTNEVITVRNLSQLSDTPEYMDYGASAAAGWLTRKGRPRFISLDVETDRIRLIPIPEEDDVLITPSFVLPRKSVINTGSLEISDERYRRAYGLWLKKRAYEKQDSEVFSGRDSEKFFTEFLSEVEQLKSETRRATRKPGTVRYGGL